MPATVISERVGWHRSIILLKDRVRELRPLYLPPDPASRTTYVAGERVQCDLWFPPVDIPLGLGQVGRPPVPVMAAGYSRMLFATMIPSRQAPDLHVEPGALGLTCSGETVGPSRSATRGSCLAAFL